MLDRLTHENLRSNPHASLLFRENAPGLKANGCFWPRSEKKRVPNLSLPSGAEADQMTVTKRRGNF